MHHTPNHCIQATPGFALLFVVAQVPGAPDAGRSAALQHFSTESVKRVI